MRKIRVFETKFKVFLAMVGWLICTAAGEGHAQRAIIARDGVRIYSLPLVEETPMTVLSRGDTVRVIGRRGDWVKLELADGVRGWMPIVAGHKAREESHGRVSQNQPSTNGRHATPEPDIAPSDRPRAASEAFYRRFGYTFGMGLLEFDFTYNWKFVFHFKPRVALVGAFKHALGGAADSYFITVNWAYLLEEEGVTVPYITGGMGIINTVPVRSLGLDSVSHMAINYGVGVRRRVSDNLSVLASLTQHSAFVGKGVRHAQEVTVGVLVGKFWD